MLPVVQGSNWQPSLHSSMSCFFRSLCAFLSTLCLLFVIFTSVKSNAIILSVYCIVGQQGPSTKDLENEDIHLLLSCSICKSHPKRRIWKSLLDFCLPLLLVFALLSLRSSICFSLWACVWCGHDTPLFPVSWLLLSLHTCNSSTQQRVSPGFSDLHQQIVHSTTVYKHSNQA